MKRLPIVFKIASGVFGVLPGIGVLAARLGVPPGKGGTFAAVLLTFGPLAILLLWVSESSIRRWTRKRIINTSITLTMISLLALTVYFWAYSRCVVIFEKEEILFPLWSSGNLDFMLQKAGNPIEALYMYQPSAVKDAIAEQPAYILASTTMVLLVLYQAVFMTLTLAFGIAGIKTSSAVDVAGNVQPKSPKKATKKVRSSDGSTIIE